MSWINIISYQQATGKLKRLYDKIKGPDDYIDSIMLVHGLRPNTLEGHMALYKNVLHHANNEFPKWFLEAIGVYVSWLNQCDYCVEHHTIGMSKELTENESDQILRAFKSDQPGLFFKDDKLAIMKYARVLTKSPEQINEAVINNLKEAGVTDGLLLEVNQVIAYFCYANRTVLGLGVNTANDIIGLSPGRNNESENWHHE